MANINAMARKEFYALPSRKWDDCSGVFLSLVLLPLHTQHDSGFAHIDVVGVNSDTMVRLSGCSDVLHLQGGSFPDELRAFDSAIRWNIDLLWRSKLFNLFTHRPITVGAALSSLFCYGGTSK